MAYNRTFWQDHVTEYTDRFKEVSNSDGTISHTPVEGEIIQQGTPQNARNFNTLEEGTLAANIQAMDVARVMLHHESKLKEPDSESGEITLTNSQKYPFNNSIRTVALKRPMDTTAYSVETGVISSTGEVGHIVVSDRQMNGFKIEFTGSATNAKSDILPPPKRWGLLAQVP